MKKLLFLCLFTILLPLNRAMAQKVAFVDTEYILNQMPEYKSAQKQIDALAQEWQKQLEKMKAELDKLKETYNAEKFLLSEDLKAQREKEIQEKERAYRTYQREKFGYEGELFKKRQELIKPIQDRVFDAIQKVARDNALDIIFDKSGAVTMLFANPRLDRSDEVLDELGIVPGGVKGGKEDKDSDTQDTPPAKEEKKPIKPR